MSSRKLTRAEWSEAIEQWRRSGLGRDEFCRRRGLSGRRMVWWENQLGKSAAADNSGVGVGRFVEVTEHGEVVAAGPSARLEIEIAGVKLRIPSDFDERAVGRLLALLEARR